MIRKVLIENFKSISNLTIELGRHFETNPKLNKLHQRQFLFRLKVNAVPYFCLSGSMSGEWKRKRSTRWVGMDVKPVDYTCDAATLPCPTVPSEESHRATPRLYW